MIFRNSILPLFLSLLLSGSLAAATNALVVIDMQDQFAGSSDEKCRESVVTELESAMTNRWPIVLVYNDPLSRDLDKECLLPEIKEAIGFYDNCHYVRKHTNCGATEITHHLKANVPTISHLRVCGVQTDRCVRETVEGLARNGYHVLVQSSACGTVAVGPDEVAQRNRWHRHFNALYHLAGLQRVGVTFTASQLEHWLQIVKQSAHAELVHADSLALVHSADEIDFPSSLRKNDLAETINSETIERLTVSVRGRRIMVLNTKL